MRGQARLVPPALPLGVALRRRGCPVLPPTTPALSSCLCRYAIAPWGNAQHFIGGRYFASTPLPRLGVDIYKSKKLALTPALFFLGGEMFFLP